MDTNEEHENPPTKRRKVDLAQHDTTIEYSDRRSYITLAQTTVPVTPIVLDKRDKEGSQVDIRSVTQETHAILVQISAPWLRSNATLRISGCSAETQQMLEDCAKLDSITKTQKVVSKQPIACHDAILSIESESATLYLKILWHNTVNARDRITSDLRNILSRYAPPSPDTRPSVYEDWHVREFYDNVHVPAIDEKNSADLQIDLLDCELYPFQRRAVRWLLSREGVEVQSSGQISELSSPPMDAVMLRDFHEKKDAMGGTYFINHSLGVVCSSRTDLYQRYGGIKGGLLGEAMGLGKTVEMIALMSLHTMQNTPLECPQSTHLQHTGATLIITPPAILEQWKQELQIHAPSLRVYHYHGQRSRNDSSIIQTLTEQDVVLTTYNVIAKEFHYVMEKPERALRNRPRYESPKSPLDQMLWWRVCLDEAQMIESGVSAAATVARLIPRVNAWAVTGTPLKQSHKDLYGLLLFLRYEPWSTSFRLWTDLVSYQRPLFRDLIGEITIRHSKEAVREELRLPPQTRHTITISFSNIEQAHYSQMFYDMARDCGLQKDGSPLDDEWDPDHPKTTEKMRSWLTRLRQTCVHPEVGGRNRRALGKNNGPLRTVQQVLDVMIDQTESGLRTEQRTMLTHKIRQGQVLENAQKRTEAMNKYGEAYEESSKFVEECRMILEAELLAQDNADLLRDSNSHLNKPPSDKEQDEEAEEEDDSQQLTARQRLRSALEIKHVCIFFMGNMFYQIKSSEELAHPGSEQVADLEKKEAEAYEEAKKIRGELLSEVLRKANRQTASLKSKDIEQNLVTIPEMEISLDDYKGIESRRIFDKLYDFCDAMNVQAEQLEELRTKMVELLRQGLIDEDEGVELQGDEYESSTKHQDEMYAYMEALRALYADRSDAISGQENLLIKGEMKQFLRSAKEGEGPAPELMIKLLAAREEKRVNVKEQGSLRGIVTEIRALVSALEFQELSGRPRAAAEIHIATNMLECANKLMSAQNKCITGLEQEVNQFRNSMNARLEYYKALQKISDTVAPYREEDIGKDIHQPSFDSAIRGEEAARNKCSSLQAKQRYLMHLKTESVSDSTPRICTICREEFELGAITSCGHVFCKEDLQLWYSAHGNCPVCKRRLHSADFFDVTYKPLEMTVQAESPPPESSHGSLDRLLSNSIYSDIGEKQLNQIKNIDIRGASFGSKVDTICRHLHWLREQDPGSKTIIFSQFREVLDVLGRAFRQNAISFSRCDDKSGIEVFKSDPSIECFLLHAKAHSAGLNLVVASHVILCEPLINTAIELQAIARVHRIGQHRATTVWMYLISGTVEESIYDISVQRRLAHINSRDDSRSGTHTPVLLQESAIEAANSKELQLADLSKVFAQGKSGGEMVRREDLWPCLFGSVNKESNAVVPALEQSAESLPAGSEVGRFLRAEAAERRRGA